MLGCLAREDCFCMEYHSVEGGLRSENESLIKTYGEVIADVCIVSDDWPLY